MNSKLIYLTIMGVLAYIVWGILAFTVDKTQIPEFMHITSGICIGVIGLVLRDMQPAKPSTEPTQPTTEPTP